MNKFVVNDKFDNLGFNKLTTDMMIDSIEKYQRCLNRLYKADNENWLMDSLRAMKIDTKNIGISDKMAEVIAPQIDGILNSHTEYPDILTLDDGVESKATWLRTKWKGKDYKEYKSEYGFGIMNPHFHIPSTTSISWSSHYRTSLNLLAFAWDFNKEGYIVIIGSWFAKINEDDWTNPPVKLGKKNTPSVSTRPSAKIKLASNWIVINSDYIDMFKKSGYIRCNQKSFAATA